MIDLDFLDRQGNPIPGKVPVQFNGYGDAISENALGLTRRAFLDFVTAYKLGLYTALTERVVIDTETVADFEVNHGVFKVDVTVKRKPNLADYYGGIVVQLQRFNEAGQPYLNDVCFDWGGSTINRPRGDDAYPKPEYREVIPEAQTFDRRFSVSGPLGDIVGAPPTDTLLFQIESQGDLTSNPVASGVVKIFRIRSPWVGDIASYANEPNEYIVSTSIEQSMLGRRAGAFFLGGQILSSVPPTPWSAEPVGDNERSRLYTFGFKPTLFAEAGQAQGVIVFLLYNQVLLYDTSLPAMGWVVCAETTYTSAFVNEFGFDFTVNAPSGEAGSISLTCSGTNGNGACSSFEVSIGARRSRDRTASGAINAVYLSPLPPVTVSLGGTITKDRSSTFTHTPTGTIFNGWYETLTLTERIENSVYSGGGSETTFERDSFVGGVLNSTTTSNSIAFEHRRAADGTITASISIGNHIIGAAATMSLSASGTVSYNNSGSTSSGVFREYSSFEVHKKSLAWRLSTQRGGSWVQSINTNTWTPTDPSMGTASMSAISASSALVGRQLQTVASVPGLGGFGATVDGSEGYSANFNVPTTDSLFDRYDSGFRFISGAIVSVTGFFGFSADIPNWMGGLGGGSYGGFNPLGASPDPYLVSIGSGSPNVSTVTGAQIPAVGTVSAYEALGGIDIPTALEWVGTIPVESIAFEPVGVQELAGGEYEFQNNRQPDWNQVDDRIYADPRTGGYIAQYFWEATIDLGGFTYRNPAQIEMIIGNLDGSAPLVDILNEWIALTNEFGVDDAAYETVFINRDVAKNVSLI